MQTGFKWRNLRERDHFVDPGLNGRIILRWILRKLDGGGGMDWIELAQNKNRWWALMKAGSFLTS